MIINHKFAKSKNNTEIMSKIYTIGESLLDIIFKNNQPITAKAGGSMLNSAISLGRLNMDISHISEFGKDSAGTIIEEFLQTNNVNTTNISSYNHIKTTLALAFLDNNNNATYSFYKDNPKERTLNIPEFNANDILLFGSIYAITKELRKPVIDILNAAKKANAIIIYDPNFRKNHLNELNEVKDFIKKNTEYASIIKASDEDIENIFGITNKQETYNIIKTAGCNNLIITENKKGVSLFTKNIIKHYDVPDIIPVSTIGAGDSFNAGIIYALYKLAISNSDINNFDIHLWDKIIEAGIAFASDVCMSYDNYISDNIVSTYTSVNNDLYS